MVVTSIIGMFSRFDYESVRAYIDGYVGYMSFAGINGRASGVCDPGVCATRTALA